jgi:probable F420-dependent oxidoreductase
MPIKVGVQFHIQGSTIPQLRSAWREADQLGLDSIWIGDHFFPVYGPPDAFWYEPYTLLAAMAVETERAQIGVLVTCNSFRNPDLLADMSRNIDHLSGGRFALGMGAGGRPRDFAEYGFDFGTAASRLEGLEHALPRIRNRLRELSPPPLGPLPLLIGGGGEGTTLRIAAAHADAWNWFGPADSWAAKSRRLDEWCGHVGRDPRTIERTVAFQDDSSLGAWPDFVEAGATHLIVGLPPPFNFRNISRLVDETQKA